MRGIAKHASVNTMPLLMNDPANQLVERGLQAHMAGQFPQAQEMYRQALGNLGALYQQTGRFEDAAMLFERLARVQGNRAEPFQVLGDIYRELKRLPESEAAYRKAIALNPNLAEGYAGIALLIHERNEY